MIDKSDVIEELEYAIANVSEPVEPECIKQRVLALSVALSALKMEHEELVSKKRVLSILEHWQTCFDGIQRAIDDITGLEPVETDPFEAFDCADCWCDDLGGCDNCPLE